MSPEAENIFEMPPHLFWGSCPFWAKLRMAGRQFLFFFSVSATGTGQCGSYRGVIKQIQLGQVPLSTALVAPALSASPTVLALVVCLS